MLTADAGPLPSGEWVIQVMEDGRPVEVIPLNTLTFPPVSSHHRLIEHGYMPDPEATMNPDRWAGWGVTDFGYSIEIHRTPEEV